MVTFWIFLAIAAIVFVGIADSMHTTRPSQSSTIRRQARILEVGETSIRAIWRNPRTGQYKYVLVPRYPGRRYHRGDLILVPIDRRLLDR
jgi:hypothetical protein